MHTRILTLTLALALLHPALAQAAPATQDAQLYYPAYGRVYYYNAASLIHTGLLHHLHIRTDVDGYTANRDCKNLGRIAYLSLPVRVAGRIVQRVFRLQITDCSAPADLRTHIRNRNVGEINRELARRVVGLIANGHVWGTLLAVRSN